MIRKIRLYLVMAALALGATSCLDQYPDNAMPADKAINNIEEANQAVMGIYAAFKSPALYSGALTLLPDLQADLAYAVNGYSNVYGDIWRWDILATNDQITSVYGSLYDLIARCNFLLEYAPRVRENTTNDKDLDRLDMMCGEAYFARALAYSELIKLFCKAYESDAEAANELGVVLISRYHSDEPIKRASLKDSYDFVLGDLDKAAELLKLDKDYNPSVDGVIYSSPYFSEYTVYALRARIALYKKDYNEAIKYSSKVIDSKYFFLSSVNQNVSAGVSAYKYMWTSDNSTETIWKVGFTINSYGGALGQVFFNYDFRTMKPDYVPAEWVLNLYDANDQRGITFFKTYTTGYSHGLSWPLLVKYYGNEEFFNSRILHTNMPKVFRLSEQYLIRAEAYSQRAQGSDLSQAGKDITTLRIARYSSYGGTTNITKDNALTVIEQERVRELYMEGFRLTDLKRWHKGFKRKPQTQSLSNGSSLNIEKDNALFVWPIPKHELEAPGANIEPNESNK